MIWKLLIRSFLLAAVTLFRPAITLSAEEEKAERAAVEEALKKLAAAVQDDNYSEVAKWITPPADQFWINIGKVRSALARYETALEQQFGKSNERFPLETINRGSLNNRYQETRGTIHEMKKAGKDRLHITVWIKEPLFGSRKDGAIYERKFTAVKSDGQWKFQLRIPIGGSPVVKKVQRIASDGKDIEVYAEHNPKGSSDMKNWEELKPTSYADTEEDLKRAAAQLHEFALVIQSQTEQLKKGDYQSREEALKNLMKACPMWFR